MKKIKIVFLLPIFLLMITVNVKALNIDDVIANKEVTVKSVPANNYDEFYTMVDEKFNEESGGYGFQNCNETYTVCDLQKEGVTVATNVVIKYEYDKDVKTVVDGIISKFPEGNKVFIVEDVEALKWVVDSNAFEGDENDPEDFINPIRYSSEYNKLTSYNNFIFEPRMGDLPTLFAEYQGGGSNFIYDGTVYGRLSEVGVRVNKIMYVNDDETDIIGALKTRLSKYFDFEDIIMDTEMTLAEMFDEEFNSYRDEYNTCVETKEWLDNEKAYLDSVQEEDKNQEYYDRYAAYENKLNLEFNGTCNILDEYETLDDYIDNMRDVFLDPEPDGGMWNFYDRVLPNVYVIKFNDDLRVAVLVSKDSSKVFNDDLELVSKDSKTGVTVSTSGVVPLDTLIQVAKLTNGETYNKIAGILNKENIEMFDIKLFSKSASNYITQLDDGSFEVRLPISDSFKGKDLVVYYVDNNDKVQEIAVTLSEDNNLAIFKTNHFSVYTLAEKEKIGENNDSTLPDTANNDTSDETNDNSEISVKEEIKEETNTSKDIKPADNTQNNPQTYDNIIIYIVMFILSVIGLISSKLSLIRIKNN